MCTPSPRSAIRAALIALSDAIALRSMHGICTSPPTGSQVSPRLCSIADLGGVLDLLRGAAEHLGQPGRRHRAGRADLALAADLGAGDRRVLLEQHADRAGRQQEPDHAVVVGARHEPGVVVQHRGNDARRRRWSAR